MSVFSLRREKRGTMKNEKKNPENHDPRAVFEDHMKIRDMPEEERPYEKCEKYGPAVLSDAELLAVVIRTGSRQFRSTELAYKILKLHTAYTGVNCLFHMGMNELTGINGIGRIKAIQLICCAELARRMNQEENAQKLVFDDPSAAIAYFSDRMRHLEHEEVHAAYLDMKMRLISSECIYKGTLNKSVFEPREIFSNALRCNAAYLILAHNHPSGNATPSDADISATKRIDECGKIMGIKLYDHVIIGYDGCVSMKEEGLI